MKRLVTISFCHSLSITRLSILFCWIPSTLIIPMLLLALTPKLSLPLCEVMSTSVILLLLPWPSIMLPVPLLPIIIELPLPLPLPLPPTIVVFVGISPILSILLPHSAVWRTIVLSSMTAVIARLPLSLSLKCTSPSRMRLVFRGRHSRNIKEIVHISREVTFGISY